MIALTLSQIGDMDHSLDIFGCKGEFLAKLSDKDRYGWSLVLSLVLLNVHQGLGHTSGDVFPPQRCRTRRQREWKRTVCTLGS
jgi:hypothetical protein